MEASEALRQIEVADSIDRERRVERLSQASAHRNWGKSTMLAGTAAPLLFDDVKTTWIYGIFASTVITAAEFCLVQVVGALRLIGLPAEQILLDPVDELLRLAQSEQVISSELHARLVELHDRARLFRYSPSWLVDRRLDDHLEESRLLGESDPLRADAESALLLALDVSCLDDLNHEEPGSS